MIRKSRVEMEEKQSAEAGKEQVLERVTIGPEVKRMLRDYYRVTGVPVGIYDAGGILIESFSYGAEGFSGLNYCERCKLCSERWLNECMKSDADAFEAAMTSGKPYIYACTKGFYEAVIPIRSGEDTVLYLMIGQVRPPESDPEGGSALFHKYACETREDFDVRTAQAAYEEMDCMDLETFESHVRLLELCAQKIGADEFVRRSQRSVSAGVMRYVAANLYNPITVNDAAEALNYSVSYLSHAIAREMGTTFTRYVNACRVAEAKRLLRLTNMNVEKIAAMLQYNGVAYFVRQFKREAGMTCTEYRELRGSRKK